MTENKEMYDSLERSLKRELNERMDRYAYLSKYPDSCPSEEKRITEQLKEKAAVDQIQSDLCKIANERIITRVREEE